MTTTRTTNTRMTASEIYLQEAERILGIGKAATSRKQASNTKRQARRIALPGGCVLYVTTVQFWQRQHGGNAA